MEILAGSFLHVTDIVSAGVSFYLEEGILLSSEHIKYTKSECYGSTVLICNSNAIFQELD